MDWLFLFKTLHDCHYLLFSFHISPTVSSFSSFPRFEVSFFLSFLFCGGGGVPKSILFHEWNTVSFVDLTAISSLPEDICWVLLSLKWFSLTLWLPSWSLFLNWNFWWVFLLQGFPSSVTPDYAPFQLWDSLQVAFFVPSCKISFCAGVHVECILGFMIKSSCFTCPVK